MVKYNKIFKRVFKIQDYNDFIAVVSEMKQPLF